MKYFTRAAMASLFRCGVEWGCLPASKFLGRGLRISVQSRTLGTDRLFDALLFDVDSLSLMDRKELQRLCKKLGLKANCKTAEMTDQLRTFYRRHVLDPSSVLHFPYVSARTREVFSPVSDFAVAQGIRQRNRSVLKSGEPANVRIGTDLRRLCMSAGARGTTTAAEIPAALQAEFLGASKQDRTYLDKVVSVSHILNKTCRANRLFMISKWRKAQIQEMGEEGFKEHATELSRKGIAFHRLMNSILSGHVGDIPQHISLLHKSVAALLQDLTGISVARRDIVHRQLGYCGTFDDLALYRDSPCMIEWKTSQKPKQNIDDCFDYPLQVVAYAGALNSDPQIRVPVTQSMIVVAYHDGSPADVHFMDLQACEKYWQFWLLELHKFKHKHEHTA